MGIEVKVGGLEVHQDPWEVVVGSLQICEEIKFLVSRFHICA